MSAFQSAQPRARAQVASSNGSERRNSSRSSPAKKFQAITRSQAGSPTPAHPKSITARRRPSMTSRLDGETSPCTHSGGRSHTLVSAASHTSVAASASISSDNSSIDRPASTSSLFVLISAVNVFSEAPRTGRPAQRGNCSATSPATSAGVMSALFTATILAGRWTGQRRRPQRRGPQCPGDRLDLNRPPKPGTSIRRDRSGRGS